MALARAVRGNVQPLMQSFARQEFVPETPRIVNTTLNRRKMNQKKVQPCLWRPNLQALSNGALQGVLLSSIRPVATTPYAMRKSLTDVNFSITSQVMNDDNSKGHQRNVAISGKTCPLPGSLPHGNWTCEMQEIPIYGTSFLNEDAQSYPGDEDCCFGPTIIKLKRPT